MQRRRRAARGPLGKRGDPFILDVILHLEEKQFKNKVWVHASTMGSGLSLRLKTGQDQTAK
jgi:hypothetical protein